MSKLTDAAKIFFMSLPLIPLAALAASGEKLQKSRHNPLIGCGSLMQDFGNSLLDRMDQVGFDSSVSPRTLDRMTMLGATVGIGVPVLALSVWVKNISPVASGTDVFELRGNCDRAAIVEHEKGKRELKVPEGCQLYR